MTGNKAQCPTGNHANGDRDPSLSIGQGDNDCAVVNCHLGCPTDDVLEALGMSAADLFDEPRERSNGHRGYRVVAEYRYTDGTGAPVHQGTPRPQGLPYQATGRDMGHRTGDTPRVLYNLPAVLAAPREHRTVWLVEGEADADRLIARGEVATCNFDGAAKGGQRPKWKPEYGDMLKDANVVIIADRDEAGYAHAAAAQADLTGKAAFVTVMQSATTGKGDDVSDHLAAGYGLDDLIPADGDTAAILSPPVSPPETQPDQGKGGDGDSGDAGDRGHGSPPSPSLSPSKRRVTWTAPELVAYEFPEQRWAIPGIVADGLTLLAGAPKSGKSWLAYGAAVAVATGGKALGRKVTKGDVLYLALEDTGRRLKERLEKILAGGEAPAALTITIACDDASAYITGWLQEHPDARLVIIDVLARVRAPARAEESRYDTDYRVLGDIKAMADTSRVPFLVLHHTRKMGSADFVDEISGTGGVTGAVDAILVLRRLRGEVGGLLQVTGRDVEEAEYALKFAADIGAWQESSTPPDEVLLGETRAAILRYLKGHDGDGPAGIAKGTGIAVATVKQTVWRMAADDQLDTDDKGRYFVPPSGDSGSDGGDL